jgi:hypothetical protein
MTSRHSLHATLDTEKSISVLERLHALAIAVIVAVIIVGLILWLQKTKGIFDPPYLILSLNVAIIFLPAVLIAAITVSGFLSTGSWPVLSLGLGTIAIAISTVIGSALLPTTSVNASETSQEVLTIAAAGFYLVGAFAAYNKIFSEQDRINRLSTIFQLYGGLLIFIIFIVVISAMEILPPFFIQGQGGTPIRDILVFSSMSILLF